MALYVQKFGGTSVGDPRRIARCAARVRARVEAGDRVVVVASAMGHSTDELIALAGEVTDRPDRRELDFLMATGEQVSVALLAMALDRSGVPATALTGAQAGIVTDGDYGRARVVRVDRTRLDRELEAGRVPVVCGFQGESEDGELTTLGRGGSDTTAVAIAAALGVAAQGGVCEIFTDVDGVYTADPRLVPSASRLARISYEEMLELALLGAQVMHPRAVLFGERYGVPIHVRHSQRPDEGTLISRETPDMEDVMVVGAALKPDLGRVSLRRIPNNPGVQGMLFEAVAKAGILVDDIVQTEFGEIASISFTVDHSELADVKIAASQVLDRVGTGELAIEIGLAKVSVVGTGMKSHVGVASRMFSALGAAGIPIHNITTSEIKISCIVSKEHATRALAIAHEAFGLDRLGAEQAAGTAG
ncbi:MAG: Aspartokinase [Planctomycetota bacterium]|jgi:aspartate kinase